MIGEFYLGTCSGRWNVEGLIVVVHGALKI